MPKIKSKKIFVVFKTHFDIGFTALPSEIKQTYTDKMIPEAVKTCIESKKQDPQHPYVWTMPAWPLHYVLRKGCQGLDDMVLQKQIVWHALPFTTHTEFCGLEDFIRGMYISKNLSEQWEYQPKSAKMTDVPGHTWILPSLLNKAGIKFLHLGCNPCSTPPDVPPLFYWEGPDGSRMLTYYSKGDYGSGIIPPEEWALPVWLALINTGDNHGAHDPQIIRDILREVAEKSPDTEVHFGTLDDFYEALAELNPDVPVIKKDLADCWIHGVGSYPKEVSAVRELRSRLTALEAAIALEEIDHAEIREMIREAYENILLFGEHTWGMDTKLALNPEAFGGRVYDKKKFLDLKGQGKFEKIQTSWAEKSGYVAKAAALVAKVEGQVLGKLRLDGEKPATEYIKIYNTQAVKTDGLVEVDHRLGKEFRLLDEENNKVYDIMPINGKAYVQMKLPPISHKTFKIINKCNMGEKTSDCRRAGISYETCYALNLENESVKLEVDKNSGRICSLENKHTGKNWVNSAAAFGFGEYIYDVYSKREVFEYVRDYAYDLQDWYLADFGKQGYSLSTHKTYQHSFQYATFEDAADYGKITISYTISGESVTEFGNAERLKICLILRKDSDAVDFEYSIKQKQETPCPEAGHFAFPLAADNPSYRINKTGTVIDPVKDIMQDCNHVLYCCDKWVDVFDGQEGLTFLPFDTPLLSIGEKGIERYSRDYVPQTPDLYFNAFNNQWGTNFPQWIGGDFTYRFRLIPHSGSWDNFNAPKRADEAWVPFIISYVTKEEKNLAAQAKALIVNSLDTLEVVALKNAEDGNGLILRLRETAGRHQDHDIIFSKYIRDIYTCSLLENESVQMQTVDTPEGKQMRIELKPFEIITLRLIANG